MTMATFCPPCAVGARRDKDSGGFCCVYAVKDGGGPQYGQTGIGLWGDGGKRWHFTPHGETEGWYCGADELMFPKQ
jgi:hypothetical protein